MKLLQKVYVFDTNLDLGKAQVNILINGKDESLSPKHVFKNIELEDSKISGYSILQFYKSDKGSLFDKEGNEISFSAKGNKIALLKVRDPLAFIDAPLEVSLQYIKDVAAVLGLEDIEKTISGLAAAEKNALAEELAAKAIEEEKAKEAEAIKKEAEAIKLDEAKQAEEAKILEEEKKREAEAEAEKLQKQEENKIPEGDDILTDKQLKITIRKYQRMGFSQFKHGDYTLFYGSDVPDAVQPFIVVDMKKYYKRLEGSVVSDDEKGFEYEFSSENQEDKVAILNEGQLEITSL